MLCYNKETFGIVIMILFFRWNKNIFQIESESDKEKENEAAQGLSHESDVICLIN